MDPLTLRVCLIQDRRCALCRKINVEPDYSFIHHNERTLKASASRGCPVCAFFYSIIVLNASYGSRPRNPHAQLKIICRGERLEIFDFSSHLIDFEFYRVRGTILRQASGTSLQEVHPSPTSPACFRNISDWIVNCVNNHDLCNQQMSTAAMPFRLIDVRKQQPVLVSDQPIGLARYIALSYCWGNGTVMTTTTTTLQARCRGIAMYSLPKTLQDAVSITRRLRIDYLWIDSLCILQDSSEDWQREAPKMGEYYRNAFLTLSALDSPDANSGMLHMRKNAPSVHLDGNLYLRPASRSWQEVFREAPLSSRAWALQERMISTRVLHYGIDDVFWECLKSSRRESSTIEHTLNDQSSEWQDEAFKRLLFPPAEIPVTRQGTLDKWYRIVRQYSELKLTCAGDKLPAISGIASRVQDLLQDSYLGGLWKSDIHDGLLWFSDGPSQRPQGYRAPSWSWACLDGSVDLIFDPTTRRTFSAYDAVIINAWTTCTGKNEFGMVKEANIEMRVLMKDVQCSGCRGDGPYDDSDLELIVNILDEYGELMGTGYLDSLEPRSASRDTHTLNQDLEQDGQEMVKAIWISERRSKVDLGAPEVVYFLLVIPVWDSTSSINHLGMTFKRVGIGHTQDLHSKVIFGHGSLYSCESHVINLV
ncbi:heterokaryon incompatibility protein-domain-containing protein [Tricladium varicosporioides]|nr:heterokaryon incompatibility protein-domain-containing protein [Hymenoscyphus varicosporioides]